MEKKLEPPKLDNILGTVEGMYAGHFSLDPDSTVTVQELAEILKAMGINFGPKDFANLPKHLRRHFIVHTREGHEYRYGRKPRHLK